MPEGSLSLAPVIIPVPSIFQKRKSLDEGFLLLFIFYSSGDSLVKKQ
jgi:hypothetical protein